LEGEVLRAGPAKVALLADGTLFEARSSSGALPLLREGSGHAAILTGPAPFVLDLEWGTSVANEPGRASFTLAVPASGTARARIEVPGDGAEVTVDPGRVTKRTSEGGRAVVDATLVPGSRARVSWAVRDTSVRAPREARYLSDIKALVSVGEAELRITALGDVTVVQGQPDRLTLVLPEGYELGGVSGDTIETASQQGGMLNLQLRERARRRHQFLVSLERALPSPTFQTELALPSVAEAQRETGELAIEGAGALELLAVEKGTTRRMDASEVSGPLRSLAREPILAAFRFHRRAGEGPSVALDVKRFPEAAVLAAVADSAVATTLLSAEGRMLTEVALRVRNQAQPFLRLVLPEGATILSAEVEGQPVKPAAGRDGARVPLLRPGFRPSGPYGVSFVLVHTTPLVPKKGEARLVLPRLDLPVGLVEWEVFVPERLRVRKTDGNALPWSLVRSTAATEEEVAGGVEGGVAGGVVGGVVGGLADKVVVGAEPEQERGRKRAEVAQQAAPSANVVNLQRRISGVLPVRIDVPRAGVSYRFARPLVLDDETEVRFTYQTR
jgi:hypothetical protein